jgi:MFS family permease
MPREAEEASLPLRSPGGRPDDTARRGGLLARYRDFRNLFVGSSISLLGSSVTMVALPLTAVLYLDASPAEMGVLGAVALLPHLVLGLPAGVWVDRVPYRRTLVLADLAQTLLLGSVPILAAFGLLQMWHLYVIVTLAGTANLFETVTMQSFTPLLVPRHELFVANSTLRLSNATVNTTGSALGGLLVTLLGAPTAIAVDAISFLVSGLCKARIRHPGAAVSSAARQLQLRADILEGLRAVFAHRILRPVIIAATVGAFAGQLQAVVLVLFFVRDLHLSSSLVGVAIAVSGVAGMLGATMATWFTRRVGPGRALITGMLLASLAGLVLASAVGPFAVSVAILLLSQVLRGAAPSIYGVNQQTLRQVLIAPALLSRANATWRFLAFGGQSLGALLGGLLGSLLGLRETLIVSSSIMLAGTLIAFVSPLRSLRMLPGSEVVDGKTAAVHESLS